MRAKYFGAAVNLFAEPRLRAVKLQPHVDVMVPQPREHEGDGAVGAARRAFEHAPRVSRLKERGRLARVAADQYTPVVEGAPADL